MEEEYVGLLRCPVCREQMARREQALTCVHRHSFDIARQGYVNFLTRPVDAHYDAALFAAREQICRLGLFDALLDAVAKHLPDAASGILDIGCGEGSHLATIAARLHACGAKPACVGIDLSKDGIRLAARRSPALLWCVADMTRLPFADGAFAALLNILSPIHYAEAHRVLATGGTLIKAVPGPHYLRELREAFSHDAPDYANAHTVAHFAERFGLAEQVAVRSQVTIPQERIADLIRMTPLGWRAPAEAVARLTGLPELTVTADFALLIGQKH